MGDLTAQSDGAHTTGYTPDQLGRKSVISYPDGTTEKWTYDASGNVSTYTNRSSATCTYSYDGRNRCTSDTWSDGTTGTGYSYDAAGRLTDTSNANSDIEYAYDDSNALISESELTVQPHRMVTKYTHDVDGNVDSITYPNGNLPCFSHDDQERTIAMYSGSTTFSEYTYVANWLSRRSLYNGFYTQYDYQNNGRLWDVWHKTGSNTNVSRHCYGYAPDGQISWFDRENDTLPNGSHQSGSNLENGRGDSYLYNVDGSLAYGARDITTTNGWPGIYSPTADSRLPDKQASFVSPSANTYSFDYFYDAAGNRTQAIQMGQPTINYGDNGYGADQYAGSTYKGGNTTNSAVSWTYTYDAENRMVSAAGPGGETYSFGYDAAGRLIAQVTNGVAAYYYYAGAQRIEEHDANDNLVYLYFYDAPGSDHMLFRQGGPGGERLWYQTDAMGNTTHLSAEQYNPQGQLTGGTVVEQYLYDTYGTPTVYNAAGTQLSGSQYDNRYLFKSSGGYSWLAQAGLYYCRARFYLPQHGRFLQADPIGQAGGLNVYRYCGNDPVNGSDSTGLFMEDLHPLYAEGGNDPSMLGSVTGSNIPAIGYSYDGYNYISSPAGSVGWAGLGSGTVAVGPSAENGGFSKTGSSAPPPGVDTFEYHDKEGNAVAKALPVYSSNQQFPSNPIVVGAIDAACFVEGVAGNVFGLVTGAIGIVSGMIDLNPQAIVAGAHTFEAALLPRFGLYAGPGWGIPETYMGLPPMLNPIDVAAYNHDMDIQNSKMANGGILSSLDFTKANIQLISTSGSGTLGPFGTLYKLGLDPLFGGGFP